MAGGGRHALRGARCISENTRRDLVRLFGIDPARTSVVHLGYSMTTETNAGKVDSGEGKPGRGPDGSSDEIVVGQEQAQLATKKIDRSRQRLDCQALAGGPTSLEERLEVVRFRPRHFLKEQYGAFTPKYGMG